MQTKKTNKEEDKCDFMILSPHYYSGHNGGMWCNENYPCKRHGKWKDFNLERVNSTPKPSVKESWEGDWQSESRLNAILADLKRGAITFDLAKYNMKDFITSLLETARKETIEKITEVIKEKGRNLRFMSSTEIKAIYQTEGYRQALKDVLSNLSELSKLK